MTQDRADGDVLAGLDTGHPRLMLKDADLLAAKGVSVRILNMHTIKPLDRDAVLRAAKETRLLVTVEKHEVRWDKIIAYCNNATW